jgi:hypothetical protein
VCSVQAVQHVRQNRARDRERHAPPAFTRCLREPRERLALDVVHYEEKLAIGGHDVDGRDDVRVPNSSREMRLVEEHLDEFGILGELGMKPLDRHGAREAGWATLSADVNGRHPSGCNLGKHRVTAAHADKPFSGPRSL